MSLEIPPRVFGFLGGHFTAYDEATAVLGARFPVLFHLASFTNSGRATTAWRNFDENVPERAARLIHERKLGPVIIAFPDCFTAFGGNQYVNSSAVGRSR